VLVPARNEAEALPHTLPLLLRQEYPGPLRVVLVDDRSDDGTAAIARRIADELGAAARLRVVEGAELPPGWVGKMWALDQGARAAFGGAPDAGADTGADTDAGAGAAAYVLLTDADIAHGPRSLARLVAESEAAGLALDSRMARLRAATFWERLLIPAFVFFFDLLYPMRRVNDPGDPLAAAAGGCVLLSRAAYAAIGGFPCIRDELIDDVNLARQVKRRGLPIRLALSRSDVESFRGYDTLGAVWSMVRRTAFTELRYSWLRLAGAEVALGLLFLAPVAALAAGVGALASTPAAIGAAVAATAGALALLAMARVYRPATRFYRQPLPFAFALPAIAALYMGMTLDSAVRHALGVRSAWRGRRYATAPAASSEAARS
jgi:hopene-associated glycosyltransferase HpnB